MIMNIILFVCFFPIMLIVFFVMRNEAKPKKNLILGVTLPIDARQSASVHAAIKKFLMQQNIILILLVLLLIPQFFFSYFSVVMMWYLIWLIVAIVLPNVPFIIANKKLKAMKQTNGWFGESAGVALVDVTLAVAPKKMLSIWLFVPTIIISLIPVIHTVITLRGRDEFWVMLLVYMSFAVMTAVFYSIYRLIFHQRAEVVDENTTTNAALTQIRRYNWGKCWILTAWLTSLSGFIIWIFSDNSAVILISTLIYTAVLLSFIMRAEFRTRKMQQKLTEESGKTVYTDDDDNWLYGMFYHNPNDSHFIVNRRTGIGATINLAKAPGKILMVLTLLIVLAMPGVGLWMMREEFAPIKLEITGTQVIASHTSTAYEIDIGGIESVYLLNRLPKGTRTNGTEMDTVLKGSFRFDGIGACRLCLDPRTPPFIVVTTAARTYILGGHTSGETLDIFNILENKGLSDKAS